MSEPAMAALPVRHFGLFVDTLGTQIGNEALASILNRADLPADLREASKMAGYTSQSAADAYARIQQAMRVYYGRGARGSLLRIGRLLWNRLIESASFTEKVQAQLVRSIPQSMRPKAALELLAHFLSEKPDVITVYTLDMDLMLVDRSTFVLTGPGEAAPVCYVTLGLIQECLFWATAREHDMDEVSCRTAGDDNCEFRIKLEGS